MAKNKIKTLKLTAKGLGTFPPGRKARVVWVGLEGDLKELSRLQHALEKAFEKLGFEPEKRAFVPHLTLGRIKSSRRLKALMEEISHQQEETFSEEGEIQVQELVLYQSTLKPTGAVYTALRRIPLLS